MGGVRKYPFIALTLAYIAVLALLDHAGYFKQKTQPFLEGLALEENAELSGTVTGIPEEKNGRTRFEADISAAGGKPCRFSVIAAARGIVADIVPGGKIVMAGRLTLPQRKTNPGSFDYQNYLSRKGIDAVFYPFEVKTVSNPRWNLGAAAFRIRRSIIDTFYRYLPEKEAGILSPIIIGDQSALSGEEKRAFQYAGVTHTLVVSGFNVAYVAGICMLLLRAAGLKHRIASFLTMPVLLVYLFATGNSPPALRATVMAYSIILSMALDRESLIYQSLGLAAAVILVFDPQALFSASFQLSFAATIGIVYLYPFLMKPFENFPRWISATVCATMAVSIAAQLAVIPILAYYFNRVSLAGLVSNIPIVPLTGVITSTGILLYIAGFVSAWLAAALGFVNLWLVRALIYLVNYFAALPFASINVPAPSAPLLAVYYFILWGVFQMKKYPKLKMILPALAALALTVSAADLSAKRNRTEMVFFSLKAGSSTFVSFNSKENWLVDGGGSFDPGSDPGERVISPFLLSRGIKRLDKVVITQPRYTHYAGLKYIIENFEVGELILCPQLSDEPQFVSLMDAVKRKNIPCRQAWAGETFAAGGSTVVVLSPAVLSLNSDDNCLVLSVENRGTRVILAGGAGDGAVKRLITEANLKCDVLTLTNRPNDILTDEFCQKAGPDYLVVASGATEFERSGVRGKKGVFSTAEKGAAGVTIDRGGLKVFYY